MSRLLKSDFFRLFRSKSYYICTAIAVFLFNLGLIAFFIMDKASSKMEGYSSTLPKDGLTLGLYAFGDQDNRIILAIIVGIFITSEFTHGTMKNVISKGFSRIHVYLSKLITMIVAAYMLIFATIITGTIIGSILVGGFGDFSTDILVHILKTVGIELLLYAAFVSLLVFVGMTIRNNAGTISINILGVTIFIPTILQIFEMISKNKIHFTYVDLASNIAIYASLQSQPTEYLRSFLVAVVYFVIATAFGLLAFKKSDVK